MIGAVLHSADDLAVDLFPLFFLALFLVFHFDNRSFLLLYL
jgi:hypothetical protein